MYKIILFVISGLVLNSCSGRYQYWHLSKFNMNAHALKENEPVKIIYASQAPGDVKDRSYFIHLIAVSQSSGDTVNILTTINNGFERDSGNEVYNFLTADNQVVQLMHGDYENIKSVDELEKLAPVDVRHINKVVRDPQFDYLADNQYPSIVGWVGKTGNVNDSTAN